MNKMRMFKIKVFAHFSKGGARTRDKFARIWATNNTIGEVATAKAKVMFKGNKYVNHGFMIL